MLMRCVVSFNEDEAHSDRGKIMDVKIEKTFVLRMNPEEAGVILSLLGLISGPPDSLGRIVTAAMRDALINAGAMKVEAFCEEDCITAKDICSD